MVQKAIISLSFDDGREDAYRMAYKIMRKYDLIGTLHVPTGYVDGTWKNNNWKTAKGPTNVEQLKELSDYGFEISSHGDKHITDKEDLKNSIKKMREWKIIGDKLGFSIPGSYLPETEKESFVEFLKLNNVVYMRGGRSINCYSFLSKIYYVIYNVTKSKLFYSLFNHYNCIDINNKVNSYKLPSVVIRYGDKADVITDFIKKQKSKWIIFMFHGIQNKKENTYGKDAWCWDVDEFEKLCINLREMADNGEVCVKPILDVINSLIEKKVYTR